MPFHSFSAPPDDSVRDKRVQWSEAARPGEGRLDRVIAEGAWRDGREINDNGLANRGKQRPEVFSTLKPFNFLPAIQFASRKWQGRLEVQPISADLRRLF